MASFTIPIQIYSTLKFNPNWMVLYCVCTYGSNREKAASHRLGLFLRKTGVAPWSSWWLSRGGERETREGLNTTTLVVCRNL